MPNYEGINISKLFFKPLTDDPEGAIFLFLHQFCVYEVQLGLEV